MNRSCPKVSIGMPVYNGANYIHEALKSILSQTFDDFELIICDNASCDNTAEIVRQFAARDQRIHYQRNDRNIGPSANYNLTFTLSRGRYFKWAAHDDVLKPQWLERTVEVLDNDPTVALAYTDMQLIGPHSESLGGYHYRIYVDEPTPARRFAELILVDHRQHRATEIFGLMRSDALRQTTLQGCYARGDSILLTRMALQGRFQRVEEPLFLSRDHPAQSMAQKPTSTRLESMLRGWLGVGPIPPPEWWDASLKGRVVWPEWRIAHEYFRSIDLVRVPAKQRPACYACYFYWLLRHTPKLTRDLIFASEKLLSHLTSKSDLPNHPESQPPLPATSRSNP